jgi:peptidoglycan hydrolase-like protein with peptidoglycan-binding domain
MTAALAQLPLLAGGALLSATGTAIHWAVGRYMRAPLAHTAILAMLSFGAMAGSNALYLQHEHPAPLFAAETRVAAVEPKRVIPVIPAVRPAKGVLEPLPSEVTTGSVKATADVEPGLKPIGNAEVKELQRKLTSMQLFDGAIDGLYGPRTAGAIRRFEEKMGMKPRGELTHALLEAVRAAPVILPEPKVEPLPVPDPLPEPKKSQAILSTPAGQLTVTFKASADAPTAESDLEPLEMPAPLELAAVPAQAKPRPQRQIPGTPEEALDLAIETAGEAIETIIDGVQSVAMTTPPKQQPMSRPATLTPEPATEPAEPKVGVALAIPEETTAKSSDDVAVLDTEAKPEELMPPFSVSDPQIVAKVQRGLASLGFLHGPADGVAGEATAKAIRNFEVYYNYKVTGRISPELLDLLVQNGAAI